MRKAVVTGAAGFLGSHLTSRLVREGWSVVGIDTLITGNKDNLRELEGQPSFQLVETDAERFTHDWHVDVVFHFASLASPKAYTKFPIETLRSGSLATLRMLELAQSHGARFVLASTSEVYGDPQVHPQHESYWGNVNPIGPRAVYDESKRFSEAATSAYISNNGLDGVILRIFNTYGPLMNPHDGRVIPTFIRQALRGESVTIYGNGEQTRSLCYVDDLIDAVVKAATVTNLDKRVMNIGNPDEYTVNEIANQIISLTKSKSEIVHLEPLIDEPKRRRPDISTAAEQLGWWPQVSLAEGIKATLASVQDS